MAVVLLQCCQTQSTIICHGNVGKKTEKKSVSVNYIKA